MTDYERGYEQGKVDATKKMHPEIRNFFEDYFDKCFKEYQEHVRPWVGLAQPEQEPVAWELRTDRVLIEITNDPERAHDWKASLNEVVPLYANSRSWVGLTDEERTNLWREFTGWGDPSFDDNNLMKAIEAKLKDKNAQ